MVLNGVTRKELHGCAVDAIPQACWARPVFKYVTEVPLALGAKQFRPRIAKFIIRPCCYGMLLKYIKETRPTAAALVFGLAIK